MGLGSRPGPVNSSPLGHPAPEPSRRDGRPRSGASRPARHRARRRARTRAGSIRLLILALTIVALTWLPGSVGSSIGLPALGAWGVLSGYIGLSWEVPALLLGLA